MKRAKLLPVTLVMALMLTLPAHAFSEPELSLNYYYYPETYTAQFINKLSTTTDLSYVSELMVNLFVYNMATQDVLCNSNNVMRNPSIPWITVSWSGANELKPGYYKDEGYGMLKYGEILGWDPEVAAKEYVFHHTGKSNVYSADVTGSENAFVERGIQIASEFRNVPSSYSCYTHDQMKDFLGATAYFCDLLPQMHLCFGDTVPVYFLAPEENVIIAVKRDAEGNSYSFVFEKTEDNAWRLSDDVFMRQHSSDFSGQEVQSSSTDTSSARMPSFPEGYMPIEKDDICTCLGSVQEFLSIRYQCDGGVISAYLLSPDQNTLIVVKEDRTGVYYQYMFYKNSGGNWVMP